MRTVGETPRTVFTTKDTKSTKYRNKISETFVSFVRFVVSKVFLIDVLLAMLPT